MICKLGFELESLPRSRPASGIEESFAGFGDEEQFDGFASAGPDHGPRERVESVSGFAHVQDDDALARNRIESVSGFARFGEESEDEDSTVVQGKPRKGSILKAGPNLSPVKEQSATIESVEVAKADAAEVEDCVDALNYIKELTPEDAFGLLDRMSKVLGKPGCINECIDFNGAVSLVSVVKEFAEAELQVAALGCLAQLCQSERGAVEVFQNQLAYMLVAALDTDQVIFSN